MPNLNNWQQAIVCSYLNYSSNDAYSLTVVSSIGKILENHFGSHGSWHFSLSIFTKNRPKNLDSVHISQFICLFISFIYRITWYAFYFNILIFYCLFICFFCSIIDRQSLSVSVSLSFNCQSYSSSKLNFSVIIVYKCLQNLFCKGFFYNFMNWINLFINTFHRGFV